MQVDQVPTMAALIGHWRTAGEVLGDDGRTVVATVEGSDVYEELGPTVVHRVDVVIGGRRTRALEVVEPYDADRGVFPTRAYDDQGGVEDATATVRDGVWTFSAGSASATLRVADDGASMSARWTRPGPDGAPQPWMELRFTRVG
ncbi:hypothetical protein [Geodermatophilus obscurus]|uniref:DUF1579 domain-containing protein n=1 Tax=Geodermatophilus obscurus (strain ATCC 25078 / DSM 43160 / JCM 3152 / CCUG 61914 / KCC A-0152 / KCTC 9177 / NBRC 13315 / NRRL B-3577 / G-20) TaxID=526225 RepID=D2S7X1_GEOOG|nr:hypothetical protein [Geodermatophilus obscurus]ADB77551.1 hypothetical protein Gobs_5023 [Geodermatophilus obscurus DSM 43160]